MNYYNNSEAYVNGSGVRKCAVGLSTAHIVTNPYQTHHRSATFTAHLGGTLVVCKRERYKISQVGGGRRGVITGFSRGSQSRLRVALAKIVMTFLKYFVTLTYPAEYSGDSRVWKEQLRRFGIAFRREYPKAAFVWRLEFQKRGAPHFHLLTFGETGGVVNFRQWVAKTWYETVGSGDERHYKAGTSVEIPLSALGVAKYTTKMVAGELSKDRQATMEGVGRWWGVVGAVDIPAAQEIIAEITDEVACDVIRLMRRYARLKYTRAYKSLKVFTDANFWWSKRDMLLYPSG
jgi:hypothetical protein